MGAGLAQKPIVPKGGRPYDTSPGPIIYPIKRCAGRAIVFAFGGRGQWTQ